MGGCESCFNSAGRKPNYNTEQDKNELSLYKPEIDQNNIKFSVDGKQKSLRETASNNGDVSQEQNSSFIFPESKKRKNLEINTDILQFKEDLQQEQHTHRSQKRSVNDLTPPNKTSNMLIKVDNKDNNSFIDNQEEYLDSFSDNDSHNTHTSIKNINDFGSTQESKRRHGNLTSKKKREISETSSNNHSTGSYLQIRRNNGSQFNDNQSETTVKLLGSEIDIQSLNSPSSKRNNRPSVNPKRNKFDMSQDGESVKSFTKSGGTIVKNNNDYDSYADNQSMQSYKNGQIIIDDYSQRSSYIHEHDEEEDQEEDDEPITIGRKSTNRKKSNSDIIEASLDEIQENQQENFDTIHDEDDQ